MWGGSGIYMVGLGYIWWAWDKSRSFGDKTRVLGGRVLKILLYSYIDFSPEYDKKCLAHFGGRAAANMY